MRCNIFYLIAGFALLVSAALTNLPSKEVINLINPDNLYSFLSRFLMDSAKTPLTWVGIVLLFFSFREPKAKIKKVKLEANDNQGKDLNKLKT
tara:strand:+ start:3018 stop:3296 length:279 start_codon:yes stop_codon:yes gene_type:complete